MSILGHTKVLGVFGHPISHSLSPLMHNAAIEALNLDYAYVPFHVLPENLEAAVEAVRALQISGVNVTIPHKERIIEFLDVISGHARQIRSVNTVLNCSGRLRGETTDGPGFLRSAEAAWGSIDGARVLVLGAGGSAKAVAFALAGRRCKLVIANRTAQRAADLAASLKQAFGPDAARSVGLGVQELAEEFREIDILVNTTSVGMRPNMSDTPLPADLIRSGLLVYDLVYNPIRTRLVQEAESRGAKAVSGLSMLVYQGALSFEMWTGIAPPVDLMENAAREALEARRN